MELTSMPRINTVGYKIIISFEFILLFDAAHDPLLYACEHDHVDVVSLLLQHGAYDEDGRMLLS
jgi:hypothetical protein